MKSKIIKLVTTFIMTISVGAIALLPTQTTIADADNSDICNVPNVSDEIKAASGCADVGNGGELENVIINIINVIMGVIAIIAVVAIIIGGFQYMTSAGDPGKVKKAKDTILYAVIGIIVVALSAAIVNFVISGLIKQNT